VGNSAEAGSVQGCRLNMKTKMLTTLFLLSASASFAQSIDPLYSKQWALENKGQVVLKNITDLERVQVKGIPGIDIQWVETKNIPSEKKELIVAVLDSGIDLDHPDLKGRIWYNEKLCAGATNPQNKPCYGYNYLDNNTLLTDEIGHGTHVAGIIAANRNNQGIAGAADPRVKIMPLKVLNDQVNGFVYNNKVITDVIADAMTFAVKNGAEVINLSLGWPKLVDLPKVRAAFQFAEDNNVVVIAASGNNNKDLPTFPCSYENVICVGAIDNRGELTDFTNHGAKVDIVAPGESIISSFPQKLESRVLRIKNYETKRGSSQASPYVAAAVANLKLLHPGLTNDQVRSLLFRSSRALNQSNLVTPQARFVKYGMLDMKSLLALADQKIDTGFINPLLKSVTEIKFKVSDRRFSFPLPLKNLSLESYSGLVCLRAKSESVVLDDQCLNINELKGKATQTLTVSGTLTDLRQDSHIVFEVQVDERVYNTSLVFSRDLNNDSAIKTMPVIGGSFNDMGVISGERRLSRMTRVFDKQRRLAFPEYFYLEASKQTDPAVTNASLLTREDDKFVVKTITLPKVNRVLSIHRQDINLDGKLDYFIYTLSNKKDELQFYLLDEKLKPLFNNASTWVMTLSTFEGLPIDGGAEKFEWIKIKNDTLGDVLVPSIYRTYAMPEVDNSKQISERVIGAAPHQYYLNPKVNDGKVSIELRVVDNVKMMSALRADLGIRGTFDSKTAYLLKPFPQTESESKKGIIRSLVMVEEDGIPSFSEITLKVEGNNISSFQNLKAENAIDQSLIYPIFDLASGNVTSESVFTTLLNRATAEFIVKSDASADALILMKENWENPIIGLLGTFDSLGEKSFLIESRSSLSILKADGKTSALPIYRDSSFPGQSFSETLIPFMAGGRPGVYINSTLIYGERIYSMIDSDEGLIRPLGLSVNIPTGCVPLNPETLESKSDYQYLFLCTDSSKNVSLKFLSLEAK
jgi:cell wall-associated protease